MKLWVPLVGNLMQMLNTEIEKLQFMKKIGTGGGLLGGRLAITMFTLSRHWRPFQLYPSCIGPGKVAVGERVPPAGCIEKCS